MRLELATHLERGYVANTFRARAIRQRKLAQDRSKASIRAELEAEADYLELRAQQIDDGEEQAAKPTVASAQVETGGAARDISYIEAPNGGNTGNEAERRQV